MNNLPEIAKMLRELSGAVAAASPRIMYNGRKAAPQMLKAAEYLARWGSGDARRPPRPPVVKTRAHPANPIQGLDKIVNKEE